MADDLQQLLRRVEAAKGWTVTRRKGNHHVLLGPEGQRVVTVTTRAGGRAYRNLVSHLRRAGLDLRPRNQRAQTRRRRPG